MPSTPELIPPVPNPQLEQTASATQAVNVGRIPRLSAHTVRHFVFLAASGWLLYQGGWGTPPEMAGDSYEYVFMTNALARHGTPNLQPGDTGIPELEAWLSVPPHKHKQFMYGFVSTQDNRWFSWHFFFYSLINLPMKALTSITGMPQFQTYPLTNALLTICVIAQLLYATRYPFGLQLVGAALFMWSSSLWYLAWAHPEVMTCAFVFMSIISWFHERRYSAILLASLAAMQNPPLFLLSLYYLVPTLIRTVPNVLLNVLLCGLASFWVVVPSLFYRYHYGTSSLIVDAGYLKYSLITFQRFWGFFFDINQGMIVAMPTSLPLFVIAFLGSVISSVWGASQVSERNRVYHLLLVVVLFGMTFFIMPMWNWNHGQAGINRYASWCSMIPLAYLIQLMSYGWNSRRLVATSLLVVAPQVFVIQYYGATHVDPDAWMRHKELPLFVLEHFPRFYNPDPHIFVTRTLQNKNAPPPIVIKFGNDGTIRKIAIHKGSEQELIKYGWNKDEAWRVSQEATFVDDWAYLHPGDFQESRPKVSYTERPNPLKPQIQVTPVVPATVVKPRESLDPAEYSALVGEILPGFTTTESGHGGIALLASHFGRGNVLRTHPVTRDKPCVLSTKVSVAADKTTKLILDVSHHPVGDWRLIVRGNGKTIANEMISSVTCPNGWRTVTVDLSHFAGQELQLDLVNEANDWDHEFAYWGGARIVTDD